MASHIAAMASGTTIGSCQPVLPTGQPVNASKYINAYAKLLMHHAQLHDRNETIAQLFVTKNLNLGPEEALKNHVIELIADDLNTLFKKIEGLALIRFRRETGAYVWKIVPKGEVENYNFTEKFTFENLDKAEVIEYKPGLQTLLLNLLSNPFVGSLLLIVGMYLLFVGIKTPGYGAEIAGGICLFLALVSFGVIGITPAAVLFFALGSLLIIAEIKTHVGVLALGGAICLVLGSILLFPSPQWLIYYKVSRQLQLFLLIFSISMSALFSLIVYKVSRATRLKVRVGSEVLIGSRGVAVSDIDPEGEVRVLGEFWHAKSVDGSLIRKGEKIEVVGREGLTLLVKPS